MPSATAFMIGMSCLVVITFLAQTVGEVYKTVRWLGILHVYIYKKFYSEGRVNSPKSAVKKAEPQTQNQYQE